MRTSREVTVKVWGDLACFTRPEFAAERVSYPVITPSAAQGLLSSIFWKPEISWRITQIDLLKPPAWASMTRNEVSVRASSRRAFIDVTENRVQRHSLVLRDVAYVIKAVADLKPHATEGPAKYTDQFERRVRRGSFFSPPYLGLREYAAWFGPVEDSDRALAIDIDVGPMVLDLGYSPDGKVISPSFFDAKVVNGTMTIPVSVAAGS